MRTSSTSTNTSIVATQRWVEFKNRVIANNDKKLASKLENNWGQLLSFVSDSFYK